MLVAACHPAPKVNSAPQQTRLPAHVVPLPVNDAQLGPAVHALVISDERSARRLSLLAGVVQHQLSQAGLLFRSGNNELGLSRLRGAILLVGAGESRPEMWAKGADALQAAAGEVSRVGSEGQARALYQLLLGSVGRGEAAEQARQHLQAMDQFDRSTGETGFWEELGQRQRNFAQLAMYNPEAHFLAEATKITVTWMQGALESDIAERSIHTPSDRDEAIEAFRALRSGGATLAAIYLRFGEPMRALDVMEKENLSRIVPAMLRDRLERAGEDDDPSAWADLFRFYQSASVSDDSSTSVDPDLARCAAWGAALELYRSTPDDIAAVGPLAMLLVEYGMAEAVPLLLTPALPKRASPEELGWASGLLLRALTAAGESDGVESARRIMSSAQGIMARAESAGKKTPFRSNTASIHQAMAALEIQAGDLSRAAIQLQAAARQAPSEEIYEQLARIERQRENPDRALDDLERVVAMAREHVRPEMEAEAQRLIFEIEADRGHAELAERALRGALVSALEARKTKGRPAEQAAAERTLARVLEAYGDLPAAKRATERALQAAHDDLDQLSATIIDAARRALTRSDLAAAREALHEALDAGLDDDDCVYVALWLHMVERLTHTPSDGAVEDALDHIDQAHSWAAQLRSWTLGQLSDEELAASAKTHLSRIEATFYLGLAARANGQLELARQRLEEVARSSGIDLIEVTVARDLLRAARGEALPTLPRDVEIP